MLLQRCNYIFALFLLFNKKLLSIHQVCTYNSTSFEKWGRMTHKCATLALQHFKGAIYLILTQETLNNSITIGLHHLTPPKKDLGVGQPL